MRAFKEIARSTANWFIVLSSLFTTGVIMTVISSGTVQSLLS